MQPSSAPQYGRETAECHGFHLVAFQVPSAPGRRHAGDPLLVEPTPGCTTSGMAGPRALKLTLQPPRISQLCKGTPMAPGTQHLHFVLLETPAERKHLFYDSVTMMGNGSQFPARLVPCAHPPLTHWWGNAPIKPHPESTGWQSMPP